MLDVSTGKDLFTLPEPAAQAAFSRDGKLLVWVDKEGTVHVHDLEVKKEKFTFAHPEKTRPGPMVLSADNKTLYFTSNHGRLFRWDLEANAKGPDFGNRHNFWSLTGILLSPDESVLYSVSQDHLIKRWDTKTGKELPLPEGYTTHTSIVVAADGKHLIVTDHEGQVDYWELATGKRVKQIQKPHLGGINDLAESADGKWLAGGRTSQDIRVFDLTTGKVVRDMPLGDNSEAKWGDQVQRVAFAPDGKVLYSTSEKTGLTAWEVPGAKKLWNTPGTGSRLAVDPKGRWLACGGGFNNREQGQWRLHDARTGEVVARLDAESIGDVTRGNVTFHQPPYLGDLAWLPDGSRLVTAHYDRTIDWTRRPARGPPADRPAVRGLTAWACRPTASGGHRPVRPVGRGVRGGQREERSRSPGDSGVLQVAFTKDGGAGVERD